MPSVPKPSQAKEKSSSTPKRASRAKVAKEPKVRAVKSGTPLALQHLPKRGKMAAVVNTVKESGGMTIEEVASTCKANALSPSATKHALYLAKKLKLVIG
jgi:hypothetical protein